MHIPSNLDLWLREEAGPLVILAVLLAFTALLLYVSSDRRRPRVSGPRRGVNEDVFTDLLAVHGFDPQIARSTYQYLQERPSVTFPVLPDDHLEWDLGLAPDEIEDAVADLLASNGKQVQAAEVYLAPATVEDLVRLLQVSPRRSEPAAA